MVETPFITNACDSSTVAEHSTPHLKALGLNPATATDTGKEKMVKHGETPLTINASGSSTVVEHSTPHLKALGLSTATGDGTGREKTVNKWGNNLDCQCQQP